MGFLQRLERNIHKLEKRIEKEQIRISQLQQRFELKKITKADLTIKKRHHEDRIKALQSRIQTLKGMTVKEKQHQEEKEKKKNKEKEQE